MNINNKHHKERSKVGTAKKTKIRGFSTTEYVLVTGIMIAALVLPFGAEDMSAIERVIDAVQREHSGYLYAASVPALPRGDGWIATASNGGHGGGGGSNGNGDGSGSGNDSGGNGSGGNGGGGAGSGSGSGGGSNGGGSDPDSGSGNGGMGSGGDSNGGSGSGGGDSNGSGGGDSNGSDGGDSGGGSDGNGSGGDGSSDGGGNSDGSGEPGGEGPGDTGSCDGTDCDPGDGPGNGEPMQCEVPGASPEEPGFLGKGEKSIIVFNGASQPTSVASSHVGNPVNAVTGNKYQKEVDLAALPEVQGLSFIRHYNSRTHYHANLGANWRHNYSTTLLDDGKHIRLWQSDGRRIDFRRESKNSHVETFQAAQYSDGTLTAAKHGYDWYWRDGHILAFSREGRLLSIADPKGNTTRLSYDAKGRLKQIQDPQNRTLTLRYNRKGQLQNLTDPGGQKISYEYQQGNLTQVNYPDNSYRTYHYEDPNDAHNLTGVSIGKTDEPATRFATWAYDSQDRATLSTHAGGVEKVSLKYQKNQTLVTDSQGKISTYQTATINGIAYVKAIYGPGCSTCGVGDISYIYNDQTQITRIKHKNGLVQTFNYDDHGRLASAYNQLTNSQPRLVASFKYLEDTNKITVMRSPSVKPNATRQISVEYDDDRLPVKATESGYAPHPDGSFETISRSQTFEFGKGRRLAQVKGYRTDVESLTQLDWNPDDAKWAVHFPDGGSLKVLQKDRKGRPTQIQADNNAPLTVNYDTRGRVSSVSNENGQLSFGHDPTGQLALLSAHGREYQLGTTRSRASRDRDSNTAHNPELRNVAQNKTKPQVLAQPTGLIKVQDPRGNTTHYGIDDFGRKVFTLSPDTGLTRYAYDEANNLRRKIVADGSQASFKYDAANRITDAVLKDRTTKFEWLTPSQFAPVKRIQSSSNNEVYEYDEDGRLTSHERKLGGNNYATHYRYNDAGQLSKKTLPDGRVLIYSYHETGAQAGKLASISEKKGWWQQQVLVSGLNDEAIESQRYDWVGPTGITTTLKRDGSKLKGLSIGSLHDFSYTYDNRRKIIGIDDAGKVHQRYRYDTEGRLDFALTPAALYGYRYDNNGNRERFIVNGNHIGYRYAPNSNRLDSFIQLLPPSLHKAALKSEQPTKRVKATHNENGGLKQLGNYRFEYNANSQPEKLFVGEKIVASYQYNSRAQRISKTTYSPQSADKAGKDESRVTHFLYEDNKLIAEANKQGEITRHYQYLGYHPVAILQEDKAYAVHTNHLGAPIAVTDQEQTLVWQAQYAPFGKIFVDEDPDKDGKHFTFNLRFPGQYEDQESGLYYNHHRYYAPLIGRYISSDPLGLKAGFNTYAYVANDPVNNIDPSGLLLFAFDGTGNTDDVQVLKGNANKLSNVYKFRESYLPDAWEYPNPRGQHYYYITGPGTTDTGGSSISGGLWDGDAATGKTMPDRVSAMGQYFIDHLNWMQHKDELGKTLNIDIVGFSRGAAAARLFVNLVSSFLQGDSEFVIDHDEPRRHTFSFEDSNSNLAREYLLTSCVNVNLRFLGLWDTVAHYGGIQDDDIYYEGDGELELVVPAGEFGVDFTAHAVAVNENRHDFAATSIYGFYGAGLGDRIERGFIGAHSDIGGGYADGDLSDVAFMWMVQQAESKGVNLQVASADWRVVTDPIVHDSVGVPPFWVSGREFKHLNRLEMSQQEWTGYGMDYATSQQNFYDESLMVMGCGNSQICMNPTKINGSDGDGDRTKVGKIRVAGEDTYQKWLSQHYNLEIDISDGNAK